MRRRGGADELRAVEAVMTALPEVFAADLTPRQRRILDYIRETVDRRGYPPTVREIGEAVGPRLAVQCGLSDGRAAEEGLPA